MDLKIGRYQTDNETYEIKSITLAPKGILQGSTFEGHLVCESAEEGQEIVIYRNEANPRDQDWILTKETLQNCFEKRNWREA